MRRVAAIIAFLLTGWITVEPMAFATLPATRPVCCYKNGKHQCAGLIWENSQDGELYRRGALPAYPLRARTLLLARQFEFELTVSTYLQPLTFSQISSTDLGQYHGLNASVLYERGPRGNALFQFATGSTPTVALGRSGPLVVPQQQAWPLRLFRRNLIRHDLG